MNTTFADRLAFTRNRPAGFDWLRIGLATAVVSWHSVHISYGQAFQDEFYHSAFWRPPVAALLGMFFALSGFLVSGSLERCQTLISFVGLRVLRIFPALTVEVLLSAFILGPLVTKWPVHDYFNNWEFRHYLLNVLGIIHFSLPGMFVDNPFPGIVNGQLWTVPYELRCYEVLTAIALVGFYRHRWMLLASAVGWLFFTLSTGCLSACEIRGALTGNQLVLSFLVGVVLFRFREILAWNRWACLSSVLVSWVLLGWGGGPADTLATIPLAYLTVFLGLCNPRRAKLIFSGDYSYGIFLYGFPVQQMVAWLGDWTHQWWVNLALALPITACVAACSWWLIERPVTLRKNLLLSLESKIVAALRPARSWRLRRAAAKDTAV